MNSEMAYNNSAKVGGMVGGSPEPYDGPNEPCMAPRLTMLVQTLGGLCKHATELRARLGQHLDRIAGAVPMPGELNKAAESPSGILAEAEQLVRDLGRQLENIDHEIRRLNSL